MRLRASAACMLNWSITFKDKYLINTSAKLLAPYCSSVRANDEDFGVLDINPKKFQPKRQQRERLPTAPPRYLKMPIDQDWVSVWPVDRTFHPAVVPLPVRQGYIKYPNRYPPPGKFANCELMKIPNFLHITPPAIKRHCDAIKKFTTKWPTELKTDEDCERHFPIAIITSDYIFSGPSIRDSRSRVVVMEVKVKSLGLDVHGRDKFLRLVGDRYDETTDIVTLVADRCPIKVQNKDYLQYLLTVLFKESCKIEPWESTKTRADEGQYFWNDSESAKAIKTLVNRMREHENFSNVKTDTDDLLLENHLIKNYATSVSQIMNEGETKESVIKYKSSVIPLTGLKPFPNPQSV